MAKASSAAAVILAAKARTATALQARTRPKANASRREIAPQGIGRPAVRVITAAISASYHIFSTPAAPAPAAIARIAMKPRSGSRRAGATINPTSAVNTASAITRGFVNAMKSGSRAAKLGREVSRRRDKAIAVVFMVESSTKNRLREVCELAFAADLAFVDRYRPVPKTVSKCRQILPNLSKLRP